jgi:hypothetical protein
MFYSYQDVLLTAYHASLGRASFSLVNSVFTSCPSVQFSVTCILLNASALVLLEPFLYLTSYSYSSNFNRHLRSLELGCLTLKIQVSGRWCHYSKLSFIKIRSEMFTHGNLIKFSKVDYPPFLSTGGVFLRNNQNR